ncbi:hypothetical protein RB195_024534 [Necator americanus]|uniref:Uncharacterized protein n=1 Tax=Necator americanus TaxID=51031 RepID=A0ABR1EPA0_NECAM
MTSSIGKLNSKSPANAPYFIPAATSNGDVHTAGVRTTVVIRVRRKDSLDESKAVISVWFLTAKTKAKTCTLSEQTRNIVVAYNAVLLPCTVMQIIHRVSVASRDPCPPHTLAETQLPAALQQYALKSIAEPENPVDQIRT